MNVKSTKRKLIILVDTEEGNNSDIFNDIKSYIRNLDLNDKLSISNSKLGNMLKKELPHLKVVRDRKDNMLDIDKNDSLIRFIVHDTNVIISDKEFTSCNSHAIDIETGNRNETFAEIIDAPLEYKIHINNKEEVYSIIEDVMLDIQMFYHYGFDVDFPTVSDRKRFSLLKVEFCNSISTGERLDARYYSFATFCKENGMELDYEKYVSLWKDFSDHINAIYSSSHDCNYNSVIEYIISNHPFGGQISRNRLNKKICGLQKGRYIFAYLKSRPHKQIDIDRLNPLFAGTTLKNGSFMIVPYEKRITYCKYKKYIDTFDFVIG